MTPELIRYMRARVSLVASANISSWTDQMVVDAFSCLPESSVTFEQFIAVISIFENYKTEKEKVREISDIEINAFKKSGCKVEIKED